MPSHRMRQQYPLGFKPQGRSSSQLGVFENLDVRHHKASLQGGQLCPVQTRDLFDHLLTVLKQVKFDLAPIVR